MVSSPRAAVASVAVRILLIEDHATVRANMSEQLERAGHEVDVAVDGRSGLLLALAGAYDVLVLDLGLPHLDGLELCRR
ncbi:MAG: response regulator, partial [Planctomycetes bacterium]|nr:response regulator [Planctomycetota bacterium]